MTNNVPSEFEIFPWNRNFETGIDDIDQQHKVLVNILNRLAWHDEFALLLPDASHAESRLEALRLTAR